MQETRRAGYVNIQYMPLANRYGYVMAVLAIVHDVTREVTRRRCARACFGAAVRPVDPVNETYQSAKLDVADDE